MADISYKIAHIVSRLKSARRHKRWTQKTLSEQTGMPQSHLSNIEKGQINIKLTSLIELSRILDLEVMLIPRQQVLLVNTLLKEKADDDTDEQRPAYRLDDDDDAVGEGE
jgi:transcriptional regulator with XRE-family HTH domain